MKSIHRIILSFSLLLMFSTLAFAQSGPNPIVQSIAPASGSAAGGTPVTITGQHFEPTIVCILPCPTTVLFDKTEVVPKEASDTRLVVIAPAHAAGTVDITIKGGDGRTTIVPNAFTYNAAAEAQFAKVLLPIYLDGPVSGANGTRWATDFWVRNNGTTATQLAPWNCPETQFCPAEFPVKRTLQPNESLHNLPAFFKVPTANVSRLLYVSRKDADKVAMQLRFADVSRATLNSGTELPVLHEHELLTSKTSLLNVPFDSRFRLTLRVYDVDLNEARFRVNIYGHGEGTGNAVEHSMELTAKSGETGEFRSEAAYAQFSLDPLAQLPRPWPSALRIEIEPLTPGSRFWAFASITNNETQLVTLVTPQ